MNASQYMDKQIMDLTASSSPTSGKDFIDLMNNPQEEEENRVNRSRGSPIGGSGNGIKKDEVFPSFDFQPIRPVLSHDDAAGIGGSGNSRVWSSLESKQTNYGSSHSGGLSKLMLEKDRNAVDVVSEIDRTMKKYCDNLISVLGGVSARMTQLETRTRHLEASIDELKESVGNNHGSSEGKMRHLENILREVQTGVGMLKDKQDIMEAKLQLGKLQVSKADPPTVTQNAVHMGSSTQASSAPQQSHQPLPQAGSFPQTQPQVPAPPSALPQQNPLPPVQHPNQFPQSQVPSIPQQVPYYQPPAQTQEAPNHQQYQVPPTQQPQPPPPQSAPPHQPYQPPPPQPQYSKPPGPPQLPQHQPPSGHHPEEPPYTHSQNYAPNLRQPPSGSAPSQQYYAAAPPPHMYEAPPSNRPGSGFSTGFTPPPVPNESYAYGGMPSQYNPGAKTQQLPPHHMPQNSGSGYSQLPTARVLPQALPTAASIGSGSDSPRSGNRVPVDDVVDKVVSMGFPRDQVRATVRSLTENGQSVDLNAVLDKLMNGGGGGGEVQPQRGWFGR